MKKLLFILLFLPACAQHSGGVDYAFERYNPATQEVTKIRVHSTREFDSAHASFGDNNATLDVKGSRSGPNNLGQALDIIGGIVKAGKLAVIP